MMMRLLSRSTNALGVLLSCLMLSSCSGMGAMSEDLEQLGLETPEFTVKQPEQWELPNGLKVYYTFDDEIPMMGGKVFFPGGSLFEPANLAGISDAVGSQMREGGLRNIAPKALDKRLDDLGAEIEFGFSSEYGSGGFSCLSEDFEEVFALFAKLLREPRFDSGRLALWKRLKVERIRRRRDDPNTMGIMALRQLLYGADSPFGRFSSFDSVKRINRAALVKFHRRFLRPDGMRLALSGSIPREKVEAAVHQVFGSWKRGSKPIPELPKPDHKYRPGVYVLQRDFDQATVIGGHSGGPRLHNPDRYSIELYNKVFGAGGFSSLLVSEIRSKRGLAYSVYGGLFSSLAKGVYQVYLQTRAEQVATALKAIVPLIEESRVVAPDVTRFSEAKSAVMRSHLFRFVSAMAVAQRRAKLEMLNYPIDFDQSYLSRIQEVSPAMAVAAAKKWVKPEEFLVVVVGNISAAQLSKDLGELMPVYQIDFDYSPILSSN